MPIHTLPKLTRETHARTPARPRRSLILVCSLLLAAIPSAQAAAQQPARTRKPNGSDPAAAPPAQPMYPPGQPAYPPQGQPAYPPQGQPAYPPEGQPAYPPQGYPQSPPPNGPQDDGSIADAPVAQDPPAEAPEDATREVDPKSYEGRIAASPYRRTGVVLGGSLGTRFCLQQLCAPAPEGGGVGPGVQARLLFEYRFMPYVSAGLTAGFAYHPILNESAGSSDPNVTIKERGLGWSLLGTVTAYPVPFGRLDPFIGLGLGFAQERSRVNSTVMGSSSSAQTWQNRGALRLSFGLDIHVTTRFSIGPRLDIDRQFGGSQCFEDSSTSKSCDKIPTEVKDSLPRWVSPMIDLKGHF